MFEELKENPVRFIKTFAMDVVVVLVALAYIFYQMIRFEVTELNPVILIAGSIVSIICGITIKQALGENGFSKGYNSDIWREEEAKYNESCNSAIEYMPVVDNYYLYSEKEKKENYRRIKLQSIRLRYQDWFDEQGNFIGTKEAFDKLDWRQKISMVKAIRVKVYVLNLFSEYANSTSGARDREVTDKMQRTRNISKNTLSAVAIAIIGVYFVPVFNEWSWASLISSTMQVTLWILFGVLQLYTNFNFVVQDKVSVLRKKKEEMAKFVKGAKEGLYDKPPYSV